MRNASVFVLTMGVVFAVGCVAVNEPTADTIVVEADFVQAAGGNDQTSNEQVQEAGLEKDVNQVEHQGVEAMEEANRKAIQAQNKEEADKELEEANQKAAENAKAEGTHIESVEEAAEKDEDRLKSSGETINAKNAKQQNALDDKLKSDKEDTQAQLKECQDQITTAQNAFEDHPDKKEQIEDFIQRKQRDCAELQKALEEFSHVKNTMDAEFKKDQEFVDSSDKAAENQVQSAESELKKEENQVANEETVSKRAAASAAQSLADDKEDASEAAKDAENAKEKLQNRVKDLESEALKSIDDHDDSHE